ncbi:MAG: ParB/RepB/Spo0J family partition protein [Steroidobacteraceae bacterium]|jgi:ParB family transcriptional regulator, chromosome partitioning protein
MTVKKPSLGRGLAELSPLLARRIGVPEAEAPAPAAAVGERVAHLPLDLLQRGKYQPRMDMRPESLESLAESIKSQGLVQPILVRPLPGRNPGESQRYEIIAGERRWRAAQMAGIGEIPAVIREVPDEAALAMALIENIQREDLNPLEEARALARLIEEFGLTHSQAAEAVGRSRAAVSNLLRLTELADEVKQLLEQRSIEMGHARALLSLTSRRQQIEVAGLVAKKSLSVRDTEALVRRLLSPAKPETEGPGTEAGSRDPDIRRLERELADKLGAKVMFQHGASGKGKLVVTYNSLDELEGILAHIQ